MDYLNLRNNLLKDNGIKSIANALEINISLRKINFSIIIKNPTILKNQI